MDGGVDGYELLGLEGQRAALRVGLTQAEVKKVREETVWDGITFLGGSRSLRGHYLTLLLDQLLSQFAPFLTAADPLPRLTLKRLPPHTCMCIEMVMAGHSVHTVSKTRLPIVSCHALSASY